MTKKKEPCPNCGKQRCKCRPSEKAMAAATKKKVNRPKGRQLTREELGLPMPSAGKVQTAQDAPRAEESKKLVVPTVSAPEPATSDPVASGSVTAPEEVAQGQADPTPPDAPASTPASSPDSAVASTAAGCGERKHDYNAEEEDWREKWLVLNRAGVQPFVFVAGDSRFEEWNPDPVVKAERARKAAEMLAKRERLDALKKNRGERIVEDSGTLPGTEAYNQDEGSMKISKTNAVAVMQGLGLKDLDGSDEKRLARYLNNLDEKQPDDADEHVKKMEPSLRKTYFALLKNKGNVELAGDKAESNGHAKNGKAKAEKKPAGKKAAKAESNGKAERDEYGALVGSDTAKVNKTLSKTRAKTMADIKKEAGLKDTYYNHLNKLITKGIVKKTDEGFLLKK